ncbi:MAG: alkaline phosphatase family protein [Armatimonadota bacterium]
MSSAAGKPRLLIIGLDGGTLSLIRPWAERGDLPVLAGLMSRGCWGVLQSTTHPITPQAWTTFMTGVNAGKHGIYGFTSRKPGSYESRLVNAASVRCPTIWRLLSEAGLRVGVVAMPFTYPPESVNGFIMSGFDAPISDRRAFSPPELFDEITRQVGPYLLHETFPIGKRYDLEAYAGELKRSIENRGEICLHLLAQHPADVFAVVFTATDHVQHLFWRQMECGEPAGKLILQTYRQVDSMIGRLMEAVGPDTNAMVMSDHGAGLLERVFYLDQWLEDNGWLHRSGARRSASIRRAAGLMKRALPKRVRLYLRAHSPWLREKGRGLGESFQVDWTRTAVYSEGMYGNLFVNLKGREPEGIISPGRECEQLLSRLTDELMKLRDPATRAPVVSRVFRREELYSGPYAALAPDLLIGWRDYAYFTSKRAQADGRSWFGDELKIDASDYPHTGTHRLEGTLIMSGPGVRRGGDVSASLLDLAPTIFELLGLPTPAHMEGRPLREVLGTSSGAK